MEVSVCAPSEVPDRSRFIPCPRPLTLQMPLSLPAFAAALFCGVLAVAVGVRRRQSVASWLFGAGMLILALECLFDGLALSSDSATAARHWQAVVFGLHSLLPAAWLAFSITYSRGNYREFLHRWRLALLGALLVPTGIAAWCGGEFFQSIPLSEPPSNGWLAYGLGARALDVVLLVAAVLVLTNLEKTFRAAVGTTRWRIKFVVLGVGVIFGARIYTLSQALLYSGRDLSFAQIDVAAVLVGCTLIVLAWLRRGFAEIDIYPSTALLQSSVTVFLAGGYLCIVGLMARVLSRWGGLEDFQTQAFLVLVGIVALAVLLLSERFRQKVHLAVSRHFRAPEHDFRKIWTLLSERLIRVLDEPALCLAGGQLISETFNALSVTVWLLDERRNRITLGASTAHLASDEMSMEISASEFEAMALKLKAFKVPFDLDALDAPWTTPLKKASTTQFRKGGHRICALLQAGDRLLGLAVLGDRVNGARYTAEEMDLLGCIGNQLAAGLLNLRLTEELMRAKELEAFQTMSAFFVHDLKNAASSLTLMLKNLPIHFADPEFREDALRGIASIVKHINHLIARLSSLRNKLELKSLEIDLNELVSETLRGLTGLQHVEMVTELRDLPKMIADREQLQTVLTNLFLNAGEAVGKEGRIAVETRQVDGRAILSVADNGCGMSGAFVRDSLFRPFHSTKKNGLGIGMFQSKMIIEAHRGSIHVESEPGKGTTFRLSFPLGQPLS